MTRTRRDNGTGNIEERGKGVYRLRVNVGTDPMTGRPRYARRTVHAPNITAARRELAAFVAEQVHDEPGTSAPLRVVLDEYVASLQTKRRAVRTITEARRIIDVVLAPRLGDVRVDELTTRHVDLLLADLRDLKPTTVRRYIAVLSAALNLAVRNGWIARNPVLGSSMPETEVAEPEIPTPDEVGALIDGMPDDTWRMAVLLAALTGCRRGEVCGLRWSDVEGDRLTVRRSAYRHRGETDVKAPKSGRARVVALDPVAVEVLTAWRELCEQRADDEGLDPEAYVLSRFPDGSRPINPDTLSSHVRRVALDLGLDHVHFHSLRHYAATHALRQGVPVRDVAAALGHADGGRLLLQVYGHPTTDAQRDTAAAMAAAVPRGAGALRGSNGGVSRA